MTGLVYRTGYGRTRRPKSITGTDGAVTLLANTDTLEGITATTVGYDTENQRYLHVLVEETNDGSDTNGTAVAVYGYCHAFLRWFEIPEARLVSAIAGVDGASVDPPNVATAPPLHIPSSKEYRVYELAGVDKVAFVTTTAATVNIFAACSTF